MTPTPAECRSRIRAIRSWIAVSPNNASPDPENPRRLLLYGVIPPDYSLESWTTNDIDAGENAPLDLVENMTLNTWFYQHPGKVCGKEVQTGSREFPLTVKGTRADCEQVFIKYLGPLGKSFDKTTEHNNNDEAMAALALMSMLELEIEAGLAGASDGTTTFYQINDTLATIIKERKDGRQLYRVETFRTYMPHFLLNCGIACTNHGWFPTIKMCKHHVDEIDVLNYYAFDEDFKSTDARFWLSHHPFRESGIFDLS